MTYWIITEMLPESIDKTNLLEIIFRYKKATSSAEKNQVLFALQKPMLENIGHNYKGKLFSTDKLKNYWRPCIHAIIRHDIIVVFSSLQDWRNYVKKRI